MRKISILIIIVILGLLTACTSKVKQMKQETYTDEFYTKTRLIMLKNEIKLYKHLPDNEARKAFIEDFWKKRDPSPGTADNEYKDEYEQRLEYVERWFKEGNLRGLESDRGKVYLMIGPPDQRSNQQVDTLDRFGQPIRVLAEIWTYQYYRMVLRFLDHDGFGIYRLKVWPIELLTAIEQEKARLNKDIKTEQQFKFKTAYKDGKLNIRIGTGEVSFAENKEKDTMSVRFQVTFFVYRNYEKIDKINITHSVEERREDLLKLSHLLVDIPYKLTEKGAYIFDIIVKDLGTGAAYRDMVSYKR